MNTIDICPVGALTSRDFRFKARVWEMSATETVCPGCARGCNMYTWVRNNEILRQTPRYNPDVNDYWMCDHGRLNTFRHVNAETAHQVAADAEGRGVVEVGWDEAIARAASELKRVPEERDRASSAPRTRRTKTTILLQKFARDVLGTRHLVVPYRMWCRGMRMSS